MDQQPLPQSIPPPQPVAPIPPSPPKKNSGVLIGILLLLLGILVGLTLAKTTLLSNLRIPYLGATPTPTLLPTPSPTPDPTANWKTYTNDKYGFSIKYPENAKYEVTHFTNTEFNIMFSNLTELPYEELVIYVGNNWAYTNTNADKIKNFVVDGVSAYRENLPLGQNPPQSLVYVKHGAYYFTIQQTKDPKDPAIDQTFDQILSTFKLLEQNSQTSSCTPKFKVESGPELTASEAYSQKCYEAKTRERCEKVDIYRESTQNFGNSDGIPDCSWTESK